MIILATFEYNLIYDLSGRKLVVVSFNSDVSEYSRAYSERVIDLYYSLWNFFSDEDVIKKCGIWNCLSPLNTKFNSFHVI